MPGTITKKTVFTVDGFCQLHRMGGLGLIVRVLTAKPGTPFLTVFLSVMDD